MRALKRAFAALALATAVTVTSVAAGGGVANADSGPKFAKATRRRPPRTHG